MKIDFSNYDKEFMVEMIPYGKKVTLENFAGTNGVQDIEGFWVYRAGRAVFYREKEKGSKAHVAYYLKKSVEIPKREFFYLTDEELNQRVIIKSCGLAKIV